MNSALTWSSGQHRRAFHLAIDTKIRGAILAAAAIGTMALPAAAMASISSATTSYPAGSCTAHGQFATCVESGTATRPTTIYAHVTASPNQSVSVTWNMVCSKGTGAGGSSGSFTATTPIRRALHKPYTYPDSCSVAVDGSLARGGFIHVFTTYHRR